MEYGLEGRVAVITGASRGIGEAIAAGLLEKKLRGVVITSRRSENVQAAAQRLGEADRVLPVVARSDTEEGAEQAIGAALERFGSCDILVNNAATNPAYGPLTDVDLGTITRTWEINLLGPLIYTRVAWTAWMRDQGGVICNIASVGGRLPGRGMGAYNVSKAGLIYLTRHLAYELAPSVRVVGVAPGVVRTLLSRILWEDESQAGALHPLGRIGEPVEVASAVVFLCSDQADWITGVTLDVDGGIAHSSAYI
ncbi:MAG: SDR family oxidoreductase [bacterium]|nr:SDR family oxidoreductase [bacterium]